MRPDFSLNTLICVRNCTVYGNVWIDLRVEGWGRQPSFGVAGTKIAEYCTVHITPWTGRSVSRAESAKPEVAASNRRLEWQVRLFLSK